MNEKARDLVGKELNGFKVLNYKWEDKRTLLYVTCPVCGQKKWKRKDSIMKANSCGCKNTGQFKGKDITGKKFGRLTAFNPTNKRDKNNGSVVWNCVCECENKIDVSEYHLTRDKNGVKSCGCLAEEVRSESGKKAGNITAEICLECDGTNPRNVMSTKLPRHNTSGIKGVTFDKARGKWRAQIVFKGKSYSLGRYYKKEDAAAARKEAEKYLHEDFLKWYSEKNNMNPNNER